MTDPQPPASDPQPPATPEATPPPPPEPAQPAPPASGWQQPAPEPAPAPGWQQPASSAAPAPDVGWQQPESEEGPAPGIEFAGHGGRLVAYILDGILVSVVVIAITILASAIFVGGLTVSPDGDTASVSGAAVASVLLALLVIFIISLVYFPFFWARGGQTPGMRVFRLRVVRDRDGGRIGWGAAWLRLIGMWVSAFVFYLGFIWIFIDKRRRGWHDLIAGTVVIKDPEPKFG
jgi:uncharacterized RDD family membrane protein YckC